jgi:hypothetical protein
MQRADGGRIIGRERRPKSREFVVTEPDGQAARAISLSTPIEHDGIDHRGWR